MPPVATPFTTLQPATTILHFIETVLPAVEIAFRGTFKQLFYLPKSDVERMHK
jgi:hypothetical protein